MNVHAIIYFLLNALIVPESRSRETDPHLDHLEAQERNLPSSKEDVAAGWALAKVDKLCLPRVQNESGCPHSPTLMQGLE